MLNFEINTDAVGDLIGTIYGLQESLSNPVYMNGLITEAHAIAANEFDLALTATAGSGYLTHVFEFGVPGITRGPARVTDPTSPAARLYVHNLKKVGAEFNIGYFFRDAVIPNPQPTVASTGVASKYLRKLSKRKYIFREKATIMETGAQVEIKPKNGNLLFVPFYGEESRNPLNKRGFMMYPYAPKNEPIISVPGKDSRGTFTKFWQEWWTHTGEGIISVEVGKRVAVDVEEALRLSAARAARQHVEPVHSITPAVEEAKKEVVSVMIKKSQRRSKKRKR